MVIEFINTGSTPGFEHYYGDVMVRGVTVGSWTSRPTRKGVRVLYHPKENNSIIHFVSLEEFKKQTIESYKTQLKA